MTLPRPEDLEVEVGTEEERAEAIAVAIRVVELLTRRALLHRDCAQEVLLGSALPYVLLDHFPIDQLKIDGVAAPRGFWVEEGTGVIGAGVSVPEKEYWVTYRIGCEHDFPVILEELVRMVAEFSLGGPVDAAEVFLIAESAAALLDLAAADRERYREKTIQ